MISPGLPAVHIATQRRRFDVTLRTGTLDLQGGLYGGAGSMRNSGDMLALDVSCLAMQDLDVGRCEIEWSK